MSARKIKKSSSKWYRRLAPVYNNIDDPMVLYDFMKVEIMLSLYTRFCKGYDVRKTYLLISKYEFIGMEGSDPYSYIIQQARGKLLTFSSRRTWEDILGKYFSPQYNAVRAFDLVKDEKGILTAAVRLHDIPYPVEERRNEWDEFLYAESPQFHPRYAEKGIYQYFFTRPVQKGQADSMKRGRQDSRYIQVSLDEHEVEHFNAPVIKQTRRDPITITIRELLECAKEMKEIQKGNFTYEVLRSNVIKACVEKSVMTTEQITLREVTNIVGMVGSGKSTLINALSFWCNKHDKKMVIVLNSVPDVINLYRYLHTLKINCSPLIGKSERLRYIDQAQAEGCLCLEPSLSAYLTPACLISGYDTTREYASTFGTEPCYSLIKVTESEGKITDEDEETAKRNPTPPIYKSGCVCPYFAKCPATKMYRECYTQNVVLTTVQGFATTTVGDGKRPFIELALESFDMVVFDESDRCQKTLDCLFMPETKFNDYIRSDARPSLNDYLGETNAERQMIKDRQVYAEKQTRCATIMSRVSESWMCDHGSDWNQMLAKETVSGLLLLTRMRTTADKYQISSSLYDSLYKLFESHIGYDRDLYEDSIESPWESVIVNAGDDIDSVRFEDSFNRVIATFRTEEICDEETRNVWRIQNNRIKLILRLAYFDRFLQELKESHDRIYIGSAEPNQLFDFLNGRFSRQQKLLPAAATGNTFGMKLDEKDKDIILFRNYAFGRALMKDLPWLRVDKEGIPIGPHTLLFSGSSWAPGSFEFHVNCIVNIILESAPEKRAFLAKTRFFAPGFLERVSGAPLDKKNDILRKLTERTAQLIIMECRRNAGKVLLVVNSYDQCELVQSALRHALSEYAFDPGICRLISDEDENMEGVLQRSNIAEFAFRKEKILVAPAALIERGYNIVDETGHSALSSAFFMIRPLEPPGELTTYNSKLNGYLELKVRRDPDESPFEYSNRMRQYAVWKFRDMCAANATGMAGLTDEEKTDVVATLFILILQIFGRLARITDPSKPAPHVYFIDGAFRGRPDVPGDFDTIKELGNYLDKLMQSEDKEIAKTLYGPFYEGWKESDL